MKNLLTILFLLNSLLVFSQVRIYKGFLGKHPIQLITTSSSDESVSAIYSYDKFDTPIIINGDFENGTLTLLEKMGKEKGKVSAMLEFSKADLIQNELNGFWIDQADQSKRLKIQLTKSLEFEPYDSDSAILNEIELLQTESTKEHYFKLLISKESGESPRTVGVRVYEKKTDKLIQEIKVSGDFRGINGLWVKDYNFDGLLDFAIFDTSFSGANTSSTYILRTTNSKKYFKSEFQGLSLQFDETKKLVYEYNQCCAGSKKETTTYKIVDNKMVFVRKKCLEYSEETEDFVEVKCE